MKYLALGCIFLMCCFAGTAPGAVLPENDMLAVLRAGLDNADSDVRIAAARALSDVGDTASVAEIKRLLSDVSDTVRIAAAVSLARLGDRSGLADVRKMLANRPEITDDMTPAQRMRAVARGTVRAKAARALGDIRDRESYPLLKGIYDGNDDGRVSDACLISLGKLGLATAQNEFLTGLRHAQQEVRVQAAEALGEIGDKTSFAPLRARLTDWSRDVRGAAAVALGKLKDTDSIADITELLNDEDEIVREKAIVALGLLGQPDVAGPINGKLNDPNGMVRMAAIEALNTLGVETGSAFLLRVLEDTDRDARLRALAVLETAGRAKDKIKLKPLVDCDDALVRVAAARTALLIDRRNK